MDVVVPQYIIIGTANSTMCEPNGSDWVIQSHTLI